MPNLVAVRRSCRKGGGGTDRETDKGTLQLYIVDCVAHAFVVCNDYCSVCVRVCVRVSVCVCGVVWCGVVWCGVVWCGVVWCGVVWCGVVWCGVVWCGVVVVVVVCVCVCDVFEMYDNNILSNVVARVVSTPSSQEP